MPGGAGGHIPFCVWFSIEDQRFWNVATPIPQLTLLKSQSGERLQWFLTWGVAEGALENMLGGGLVAKSCPALVTPWTVACQAPLSMGILQAKKLSGLPFPSPGDLPDPRIKPRSPALQADSLPPELPEKP